MCRRTVLDADGVVLDADSATSDADSDDSQPKKAPDASAAELPPEELWQVHGAYYDLTSFAKDHPGGVEQIIAQKGKDCTTLFETVHLFDEQPRKVLRKYSPRHTPLPRHTPSTHTLTTPHTLTTLHNLTTLHTLTRCCASTTCVTCPTTSRRSSGRETTSNPNPNPNPNPSPNPNPHPNQVGR